MSDLPKYSYASTADLESAPLMSGERQNGWSKPAPSPVSQGGNIAQGSSSGGQRHNVLYVFEPVYPLKGEREQVVGLLGRSREECTAIAQRAFPALQAYPDERIVFEVCSVPPYDTPGAGGNGTTRAHPAVAPHGQLPTSYPPGPMAWSRIMDEAWDQFAVSPPARLRVRLEDSASDIAARKRRERHLILRIVGIPVFIVMMLFMAGVYLAYTEDE